METSSEACRFGAPGKPPGTMSQSALLMSVSEIRVWGEKRNVHVGGWMEMVVGCRISTNYAESGERSVEKPNVQKVYVDLYLVYMEGANVYMTDE